MTDTGTVPDGVGLTALIIAMARATEGRRPDAWFQDHLARAFLAAGGGPSGLDARRAAATETDRSRWYAFSDYIAVRTRFFDESLLDAATDGCRQVVILGAGLDARAFRLDWPDGIRLFEVDTTDVIGFKESVIARTGAAPRCERTTVVTDLREEWRGRLLDAGFRPDRRSVWLAEGLLIYLPARTTDVVLETVSRLATPGSRIAFEHVDAAQLDAMKSAAASPDDWPAHSRFASLWQSGLEEPPAEWLARFGWRAEVTTADERAAAWGRAGPGPAGVSTFFVRGTRLHDDVAPEP